MELSGARFSEVEDGGQAQIGSEGLTDRVGSYRQRVARPRRRPGKSA